jgi:hypothetical protein
MTCTKAMRDASSMQTWTYSDAEVTIDHAGLSACDAMPNGADSAELLDIDVDKLARVVTFVAPDRFGRLEGTQFVQPEPAQNTADGGWRYAGLGGDLLAGPTLAAQPFDLLDNDLGCRPVQPMRAR